MTGGIWARLAREYGAEPEPPEPVPIDPAEVADASIRCPRCLAYCPRCAAAPAGWAVLAARPEQPLDFDTTREALFELEPPDDPPGVKRIKPVRRDASSGPSGPPAEPRRIRPVPRPDGRFDADGDILAGPDATADPPPLPRQRSGDERTRPVPRPERRPVRRST